MYFKSGFFFRSQKNFIFKSTFSPAIRYIFFRLKKPEKGYRSYRGYATSFLFIRLKCSTAYFMRSYFD